MQNEELEKSLQTDLTKLVGCVLTDVRIRTFCTEFLLSESMSITVRANKEFKFALNAGDQLRFDPAVRLHDTSSESAKFVFLCGMRCRRAILNETKFEIDFESDARLWVELGDKSFEPLELIGASGLRHEKLDFYYVL